MTTCKTCGKEIALSAEVCPGCGARLKMGIGKKILIGFGSLIILIGIILIVNSRNDTSSTTATTSSTSSKVQPSEEPIDQFQAECQQIGYIDLARDPSKYMGNKVKFTGKVVQVTESGKDVGLRVNVTKNQYDNYDDTIWGSMNAFVIEYPKAEQQIYSHVIDSLLT